VLTRELQAPATGDRSSTVRTESIGGGPLTVAMLQGDTPRAWYAPRPSGAAGWRERIAKTRARFAGSEWLDELLPAIEPTGLARDRLFRAAEHGVVVTTGQQPGLFGGPMYTWTKAIGALALADALEKACGIPVAPLFWAATDDADFAESSTTWIPVPGGVEALTSLPIAAPGTLLAAAPMGNLAGPLGRLVDAAGSAPFVAALAAVRSAYESGPTAPGLDGSTGRQRAEGTVTAGSAFIDLLRQILEPLGVSVLDSSHFAVRRRAFPVLDRALERAPAIADALKEREAEIIAAGYSAQVSTVPGLSLVFEWTGGDGPGAAGRVEEVGPAPIGVSKTRVPINRARDLRARARPGMLSHNVLLRPVVEEAIVPTVAYLGGPSELAYFAQSSAVAECLEMPELMALPRWSCTIIERSTAELMGRYGVTLEELHLAHGAEGRVARETLPARLRDALDELAASVERAADAIGSADTSGLVSPAVIVGARAQLQHRVARLERRVVAAAKRNAVSAMRDLATLRGILYPNGARQERVLNFIPFLARGGRELLEAMQSEASSHASSLVGGGSSALG
jgi:bacillithiol biosynthesis cysteine-adding enzyme BshC